MLYSKTRKITRQRFVTSQITTQFAIQIWTYATLWESLRAEWFLRRNQTSWSRSITTATNTMRSFKTSTTIDWYKMRDPIALKIHFRCQEASFKQVTLWDRALAFHRLMRYLIRRDKASPCLIRAEKASANTQLSLHSMHNRTYTASISINTTGLETTNPFRKFKSREGSGTRTTLHQSMTISMGRILSTRVKWSLHSPRASQSTSTRVFIKGKTH